MKFKNLYGKTVIWFNDKYHRTKRLNLLFYICLILRFVTKNHDKCFIRPRFILFTIPKFNDKLINIEYFLGTIYWVSDKMAKKLIS
jgi:hypothetical protein